MTQNKKTHLNHWKQESIGRFLLSQLTHTAITLSVLALLLLGARQVGALNGLLAPAAPNVGNSATTINYQGRLADESGTSLNGQYDLKFAIYDAAEGGAMIWPTDGEPELHEDVTVSDGLFSVGLGSRTTGGVPTSVWSGDRYLQVWVESEELAPRELLRSVPIAGMALTVPDGAIKSQALDLTSGTACLSEHVDLSLAGDWQLVDVPGLTLNFSLEKPSQVLVWMAGLARFSQASEGESSISLFVDNEAKASAYSRTYDWYNISKQRLLNLGSGSHSINVKAVSDNEGTMRVHGVSGHKTCIYYLILGEQ